MCVYKCFSTVQNQVTWMLREPKVNSSGFLDYCELEDFPT